MRPFIQFEILTLGLQNKLHLFAQFLSANNILLSKTQRDYVMSLLFNRVALPVHMQKIVIVVMLSFSFFVSLFAYRSGKMDLMHSFQKSQF